MEEGPGLLQWSLGSGRASVGSGDYPVPGLCSVWPRGGGGGGSWRSRWGPCGDSHEHLHPGLIHLWWPPAHLLASLTACLCGRPGRGQQRQGSRPAQQVPVWAVLRRASPEARGAGGDAHGCAGLCVPVGWWEERIALLSGHWLGRAMPSTPGRPCTCYPEAGVPLLPRAASPALLRGPSPSCCPQAPRFSAWGPDSRPWLFPGEEEELELAAVSCALEFNISSSSRAAPICCRRAALVFITALPGPAEPCRAGLGGRATLVGSLVPGLGG